MLKENNLSISRMSDDNKVNDRDKLLVKLCKNLNILTANGRFGPDSAGVTCDNVSLINNLICDPEIFPTVQNFSVKEFDSFLSCNYTMRFIGCDSIETR